jgi:hypothetical protein
VEGKVFQIDRHDNAQRLRVRFGDGDDAWVGEDVGVSRLPPEG